MQKYVHATLHEYEPFNKQKLKLINRISNSTDFSEYLLFLNRPEYNTPKV